MWHVCVYIYTHTHTHARAFRHTSMHTCVRAFTRTRRSRHMFVHTCMHMVCAVCGFRACMPACMHACMHACVHWTHALCLHAYAHTYMHTSGIRARVCLAGWLHVCQSCPVLTCPFCVLSLCLSPASVRIYAWMYVCMPAYTHMYETVCMYVCLDAWMVRCMHM